MSNQNNDEYKLPTLGENKYSFFTPRGKGFGQLSVLCLTNVDLIFVLDKLLDLWARDATASVIWISSNTFLNAKTFVSKEVEAPGRQGKIKP
jgi:hypothetical protein